MDVYGRLFNDAQREISIKFGKGIFVNLVSILEGWSTNSKRERPSVGTEGLILCLKLAGAGGFEPPTTGFGVYC
jgi:hypothetical protein